MKAKLIMILLSLMLMWAPAISMAEGDWFFGIGNGVATTDEEGLGNATLIRIFGGYAFSRYFSADTSTQIFDRFSSKQHDDVYVSGNGQTLGVSVRIPVQTVSISFSAGAFAWHMESHAFSEKLGEDNGVSPYAGFGIQVHLPLNMTIGGHSKYYQDVSGSDLTGHALFFGLRF